MNKWKVRALVGALISVVSFAAVIAEPTDIDPVAAAKGLEIATEVVRRDSGWGDSQAAMTMRLTNRHGDSSERQIRIRTLEVEGDGDKSLTIFDEPRDVKGTAFLSFTHPLVADEQWLYLPALKRVKRISSGNKSGPFMGSEFAFEDLTSFEVEKYSYEYLRDEVYAGMDSFVVRNYPRYEKSGYTYIEVWIDKAEYRPLKMDFYDRKGELLKTLKNENYQQYLGRYWRALNTSMVNHQTGKRTELTWTDYQFRTGLNERDFNQSSLKRIR